MLVLEAFIAMVLCLIKIENNKILYLGFVQIYFNFKACVLQGSLLTRPLFLTFINEIAANYLNGHFK